MGLSETMLFYVLIGLAVAVAVWITGAQRPNQRPNQRPSRNQPPSRDQPPPMVSRGK